MAAITQIVKSWDLAGVLDNTQDFIDQITPEDTPFYNSLMKVQVRSGSFKWVQDKNDTIGVVNPRQEVVQASQVIAGSEEDGTFSEQSERLNYAQIFRKFVTVSKTAARNSVGGRPKGETVYQIAKATTALMNQIEGVFLSGQIKQAADATNSAKTDGFTSQLPGPLIVTGGITADNIDALIQSLFEQGSTADTMLVNSNGAKALKHIMDVGNKVGPYLQWQDPETGKDWFTFTDSNGKVYKVITSRYLEKMEPATNGGEILYVYNSEDWSAVEFRPMTIEQLDTLGSYDQYLITTEVGLRHNGRWKSGAIIKAGTVAP